MASLTFPPAWRRPFTPETRKRELVARHTSYPTDRFFADYRLTVAREVIRFLQGIACEAPPVQ